MADGQCMTCGLGIVVRTGKRGAPRKYCSRRCREKNRTTTDKGRARVLRSRAAAKARGSTEQQRARERARSKRRHEYLLQRKRRLWDRWLNARLRGDHRSLEEYAEYEERRVLGCTRTQHWAKWTKAPKVPMVRKPRLSSAEQYRIRYHSDPAFRLMERMRRQFKKWLSGERKAKPSFLGSLSYSWQDLRAHIERQFVNGMDWNNSGEWHIDHIVPKSAFDPSSAAQVRACWSLENLRPLWARDNIVKGARHAFLV